MIRFPFDNSYARLPEGFFSKTEPAGFLLGEVVNAQGQRRRQWTGPTLT